MTEYLPQNMFTRLKSQLTRAINSNDPDKVISACAAARIAFEQYSYPDDWMRWPRALDDFNSVNKYGFDAVNRLAAERDRWDT